VVCLLQATVSPRITRKRPQNARVHAFRVAREKIRSAIKTISLLSPNQNTVKKLMQVH
jgi:hypothetical protein